MKKIILILSILTAYLGHSQGAINIGSVQIGKGIKGDMGEQGLPGVNGSKGDTGAMPSFTINGNVVTNGTTITVAEGQTTLDYLSDIYMIPNYGQSLAVGVGGGATTFVENVSISIDENGVNSNGLDINGGIAEGFLSISKTNKNLPTDFKIIWSTNGAGGKSVAELSKGTNYYNNLIDNVQDGKDYADGVSKTFNVPIVCWTQGEENMRAGGIPSDYGTTPFDPYNYAIELKQLQTDLDTDIKAITGQTNDVAIVMYQVGSHNAYSRYPRIGMEQTELCLNNNNFIMAKSMYDVDYESDEVHAPNKTYRNMGNYYGYAAYRKIVLKKDFKPLHPVDYFINGTDIYIKYYVPTKPLVLDTNIVAPLSDGNYGFNLLAVANEDVGDTGSIALATETITSVSLYSEDTVKISLSAIPPSGTRLTYGVNGVGWDDIAGVYDSGDGKSGRVDGARGNLRDSQTFINPIDDYFNQYNWCVISEIILE